MKARKSVNALISWRRRRRRTKKSVRKIKEAMIFTFQKSASLKTHDVSLSLSFCPPVVEGLVSVGVRLPHVFQRRVDDSFEDENAQVDHQVGIH